MEGQLVQRQERQRRQRQERQRRQQQERQERQERLHNYLRHLTEGILSDPQYNSLQTQGVFDVSVDKDTDRFHRCRQSHIFCEFQIT